MALLWLQGTILGLCALCTVMFAAAVYLTVKRRHCNVIRQRTYALVIVSAIGNYGDVLVTTLTCVVLRRESSEAAWVGFYLGVITEYLFFAPYLIRALQIKVSFVDFVESQKKYRENLHRLQPRWYLTILSVGFVIVCLFPCLFAFIGAISPNTPFTFSYSAGDQHIYKRAVFTFIHFLQVISLLFMIHYLRHVEEPYSLSTEMKVVCALLFVTAAVDAPMWPYLDFTYLILVIRDSGILAVSNLWPMLFVWDEHTNVQPTPENIRCLEFAFQHAETLAAFQAFLRSRRHTECEPSDSTSTAFSHEGEGYLWFLIALNRLEIHPGLKLAQRLYRQFLDSGEPNFPSSLAQEVKDALHDCTPNDFESIVAAFNPARYYATTVLGTQFYPRFLLSDQFQMLEKKVEMLTKRWGQLITAVEK